MFSRVQRIKRDEFKQIFKEGRSFQTRSFRLRVLKLNDQEDKALSRWAVIVPAKVVKKSTARNLAKRRIRYAIKKQQENWITGRLAVVTLTKNIAGFKYSDLESDLWGLLNSAGLLKK